MRRAAAALAVPMADREYRRGFSEWPGLPSFETGSDWEMCQGTGIERFFGGSGMGNCAECGGCDDLAVDCFLLAVKVW